MRERVYGREVLAVGSNAISEYQIAKADRHLPEIGPDSSKATRVLAMQSPGSRDKRSKYAAFLSGIRIITWRYLRLYAENHLLVCDPGGMHAGNSPSAA